MRRLLLFLILILLIPAALFAVSASAIYFASDDDLRAMCALRGIAEGTRDEMQQALYAYEGLDAYQEEVREGGSFDLSVLSAESLETYDTSVIISGNAEISFTDSNGNVSELSADTVIIDTENELLTALDNVYYKSDSEDSAIQAIDADIVTLYWSSGEIKVSNAMTSSEKEGEDGESVTFYTSGDTLTYTPGGAILYDHGVIASDEEDPYSSITASEILMLPGSDMFISNAYLSIGRVPILYLPFFFFPGSQVLGNPSFGFTSSKGAFINTTFELLGRNPDIGTSEGGGSSFMSLASTSSDTENLLPSGSYYSSSESLPAAESWARRTGSYISLMADAYENGGLHLGIDGALSFFSSSLSINFTEGIALSPESNYYNGRFRYYGMNEISYNGYGLSADLSLPFYSDSRVLMDYGNRLSGFSIMSMIQTPSFPDTYTSTISTYSRELSLDYTLPANLRTDYLSSLSISDLTVAADYRWNTSDLEFYMEKARLPVFSASLSGTLFSLSHSNEIIISEKEEEDDITDIHLLSDPLLYAIYEGEKRSSRSSTRTDTYTASLKYSLSENLNNRYSFDRSGKNTDGNFSSDTSMRLTFDAAAARWFALTAAFTPSYSYIYENNDTATIVTHDGTISSDMTLSFPFMGLEYRISSKLLDVESKRNGSNPHEFTLDTPGWDRDTITSHSISFSHGFSTDYGTFTPSISYTLPPLNAVLTPRLSYSYGPYALSFGWSFREEDTRAFHSDLIELSFGYSGTYLTSSLALKYQSSEFDSESFMDPLYGTASLSLRTEDKAWSITEYVDYEYRHGNYTNYFNSLTTTFKIPFFDLSLEWAGPAGNIEFSSIEANLDVESVSFQLWKGRLYFSFAIESSFEMDMDNPYAASFSITPSITFSIAEFLDFKFSFTSVNNGFYNYIDDNGSFSFLMLLEDLGRSFDFFGNGRYNTSFVLDEAALEITHYMKDWNFSFRYSTRIVLSDNVYEFRPEVSVYLSWKTIPDLKVEQDWQQRNGRWINNN